VESRKKKNFNKNGNSPASPGVDPRPAGDRWSPASPGPPPAGRRLYLLGCPNFFEIFLFKKKLIFGSLENGPGLLEEWVYSAPIF
jgi:hypothetical protein